MSFEKRLIILPTGVVSKNLIGEYSTADTSFSWILLAPTQEKKYQIHQTKEPKTDVPTNKAIGLGQRVCADTTYRTMSSLPAYTD